MWLPRTAGRAPDPTGSARAALVDDLRSAGNQAILRAFPQGALIVFDTDLRYLAAGGAGLSDVGLSREALQDRTIWEVFPPDVAAVIEPDYRAALAGVESAIDVPFGGRIYLQQLAPLTDADGAVVGGLGFTQDVTAARRAEQALRESEGRLRSSFRHAPIGVALTDLQGRFVEVNDALCRFLGRSPSELVGRHFTAVSHASEQEADAALVQRLLRRELLTATREKRYLRPDGTAVWALTSVSVVTDEDGTPWHFMAHVQDITDRRRHEQELAEERRRLREAQVVGNIGSWELDTRTGDVTWSDTLFTLYGLDPRPGSADYTAALACIHPDDREHVDEATRATVANGRPYRVRYRVNRADGSLRWFDARGEGLYENGRLARIAGAVADVTDQVLAAQEQQRARDAALDASRHKSAFLATMSHEIRTPMNAVIGLTGLLLDTPLDDRQREFVELVRDSGDTLLTIINDILDFTKIEAGSLELEHQPFDLWECVEGAADLLATTAAAKGLELVCDLAGCPRWVVGDVTRVRQVLVNLLSNAVRFTDTGEVVVAARAAGAPGGSDGTPGRSDGGPDGRRPAPVQVELSVTDTGIGIPADRLDRLFQPFTQIDASTTRVYGGTGLGLVISQRLVHAMGSRIEVTSRPGAGSRFCVVLSLDPSGSDGRRSAEPGQPVDRPVGPAGRVLVVDDNASSLRALRSSLADAGLACTAVGDAAGALAAVAGGHVDVAVVDAALSDAALSDAALSDAALPGLGGTDLVRRLRALPGSQHLPVVLLDTLDGGAERDPLTTVLAKPVKRLALQDAVRVALAPAADAAARRPARASTLPAPAGRRLRVLLAEDNLVNQKVGRLMLAQLGHHVDIVGNGQEALQAVSQLPYDVVLMDVHMPEMDGLAATASIRDRLPPEQQPRILAMTASTLPEDRRACEAAGMDGYLSKPVRAADLAAALEF